MPVLNLSHADWLPQAILEAAHTGETFAPLPPWAGVVLSAASAGLASSATSTKARRRADIETFSLKVDEGMKVGGSWRSKACVKLRA
jgi:hypothetical protein